VRHRSEDGVLYIGGADGIIVGCTDSRKYIDPAAAAAAAVAVPAAAAGSSGAVGAAAPAVDKLAPLLQAGHIVEGRHALLLQADANKFYIIQVVAMAAEGGKGGGCETPAERYFVFKRWGRTGEAGASKTQPFDNLKDALAEFDTAFKAKSGNTWQAAVSGQFAAAGCKYCLSLPC
jgi:predicted DNA-binding WGR domain protein